MLTETHLELAPDELPEFLFPWNLRKEAIHEHFRSILKRAGVYCKGEDTFHKLRRTCATHLTAAVGIEAASRQLGHSSVQMTRRYVDVRLTGQHNAAEHLPRPE
jgi:integrase